MLLTEMLLSETEFINFDKIKNRDIVTLFFGRNKCFLLSRIKLFRWFFNVLWQTFNESFKGLLSSMFCTELSRPENKILL